MEDAKGEPVGLTMGFQAGGLIGLYLGFSLATISVLTDAENIQRTVSTDVHSTIFALNYSWTFSG